MTDSADTPTPLDAEPIAGDGDDTAEVIAPTEVTPGEGADDGGGPSGDSITEPAKVMRIGGMVKQLLEEVRNTDLDDASRERLADEPDGPAGRLPAPTSAEAAAPAAGRAPRRARRTGRGSTADRYVPLARGSLVAGAPLAGVLGS